MRHIIVFSGFFVFIMFFSPYVKSQVKVDVKDKVNKEADNRANRAADDAIDAGFDAVEEGIKGVFKKKEKDTEESRKNKESNEEEEAVTRKNTEKDVNAEASTVSLQTQASLTWNKYDFIPGEKILFEDNQENEQNGEFPSRWDLADGGSVENASFGGQNVIYFKESESCIIPFFKEPAKDNLPDLFTIEFDCYFEPEEYCHYLIDFWDHKNQSESTIDIDPLIINAIMPV